MSINTIWSIDEFDWRIPCSVERVSEMTSSEISGLMLDKSYFNDVIGTYMKYDIKVEVPIGMEDEYAQLYKVLTDPVSWHTFILPYANGIVTVVGRVEEVNDIFTRMRDGSNRWRGLSFQVQANHPTKEMNLEQAITRGFPPIPAESSIDIGTIYVYTADGWTEAPSGDDTEY